MFRIEALELRHVARKKEGSANLERRSEALIGFGETGHLNVDARFDENIGHLLEALERSFLEPHRVQHVFLQLIRVRTGEDGVEIVGKFLSAWSAGLFRGWPPSFLVAVGSDDIQQAPLLPR